MTKLDPIFIIEFCRSYGYESASSMAKKALIEDEAAMKSSYKKSKKVMVESAGRM